MTLPDATPPPKEIESTNRRTKKGPTASSISDFQVLFISSRIYNSHLKVLHPMIVKKTYTRERKQLHFQLNKN